MADLPSAAQTDEQDFSIPGSDDEADQGGVAAAPPAGMPQGAPAGPPAAPQQGQAPQGAPDWQSPPPAPKVSGKAQFFGNLLQTLLSGIQNSQNGNNSNSFSRGFANANPANQALQKATVQKAQSEADQAKIQTAITGAKALTAEYLLKRLPVEDQLRHMEVISKFKDNLLKEGASVEAEADDEKAGDAQAMHLNGTESRATSHAGHFWSLPTMDADGKPKFDVVYVPTKDVLQNDFKWEDANGEEHSIPAGTPMLGLPKMVEQLQKGLQNDTKEQHKMMSDALKPNVPDGEIPQTVGWLKNQKDQNTPLYQQNKNAVDAQINMLNAARGQINSDKLAQARAGVEMRADEKAKTAGKAGEDALNYATSYLNEKPSGPGDEALMEKFFELAKPSTGFRMSQPQIEMLKNARSWMDSAEAKTRHATDGTWFSATQRQQIAQTMRLLAQSKGGGGDATHKAGGPAQGLQEGATGTGSDGQKYIVKGGKWQKATVQ